MVKGIHDKRPQEEFSATVPVSQCVGKVGVVQGWVVSVERRGGSGRGRV